MDKIEEELNLKKCPKCGKYSQMAFVKTFGTCLCGEVLDDKAKFKYEMIKKLRLWRNKGSEFERVFKR